MPVTTRMAARGRIAFFTLRLPSSSRTTRPSKSLRERIALMIVVAEFRKTSRRKTGCEGCGKVRPARMGRRLKTVLETRFQSAMPFLSLRYPLPIRSGPQLVENSALTLLATLRDTQQSAKRVSWRLLRWISADLWLAVSNSSSYRKERVKGIKEVKEPEPPLDPANHP
jgi:hypothetical protein